jgi:hypothetical protein
MNKLITPFFLIASLLSARPSYSQYRDSIPARQQDTLRPKINWDAAAVKKGFPYKSFIVPSAMVVFGVVTSQSKGLWSVNEKIKEEVYTDRSSTKTTPVDTYLALAPVFAVYGLNAMGIKGKNNFRDRTMLVGLSELIAGSAVFTIKKFSGETRPDGSDQYSFPSGHTAAAFAAAEFMRQEYKDVSPWYGVAGYAMAATTGYLRMYNNKHWASDVVAGAGIGIISTKLAYWMYPAIKRKLFKDKEVNTVFAPTYQNGAFGFALVHRF